ncbi:Microtubule-associated serine/threonine-protein kinase 3 [Crenichthys baileyi]|uniref:Microtubule-associated serine/threonine-protein kinase 3 n=1 Tax=Crenichthys baileyi TaxID=28760 RepID=A0AAV9RAN3_9TELE
MKSRRDKLKIPSLTLDLSPTCQSPTLLSPCSPCSPCSPLQTLHPWRSRGRNQALNIRDPSRPLPKPFKLHNAVTVRNKDGQITSEKGMKDFEMPYQTLRS